MVEFFLKSGSVLPAPNLVFLTDANPILPLLKWIDTDFTHGHRILYRNDESKPTIISINDELNPRNEAEQVWKHFQCGFSLTVLSDKHSFSVQVVEFAYKLIVDEKLSSDAREILNDLIEVIKPIMACSFLVAVHYEDNETGSKVVGVVNKTDPGLEIQS